MLICISSRSNLGYWGDTKVIFTRHQFCKDVSGSEALEKQATHHCDLKWIVDGLGDLLVERKLGNDVTRS
jgi:hypothetical protein